jgi:hypothetical protein
MSARLIAALDVKTMRLFSRNFGSIAFIGKLLLGQRRPREDTRGQTPHFGI